MIQLVAGGLVLLGLGTRGAALIASGSMAYAYFGVHQQAALWPIQNGGELSALFCWELLPAGLHRLRRLRPGPALRPARRGGAASPRREQQPLAA